MASLSPEPPATSTQPSEVMRFKEQFQTYNLGHSPAFYLDISGISTGKDVPPAETIEKAKLCIKNVNSLRQKGMVAFPNLEGATIAGLVLNQEQLDELVKLCEDGRYRLSIGLPMEDDTSFLVTHGQDFSITNSAIIAAYRGMFDTKKALPVSYHRLVFPAATSAKKNYDVVPAEKAEIIFDPDDQLNQLPQFLFQEIPSSLDIVEVPRVTVAKIDINGSTETILNADRDKRAGEVAKFFSFFVEIKNLLKEKYGTDMLFGDFTGEHMIIYATGLAIADIVRISRAINTKMTHLTKGQFTVKAPAQWIGEPVTLVMQNKASGGKQVIFCSHPTSEATWKRQEERLKGRKVAPSIVDLQVR